MRARLWTGWVISRRLLGSERGASSVEYGILAASIVSVVVVVVFFLGQDTSESFSCMGANLKAGTEAVKC